MTQRHIGTLLDRKAINDINDNFTELYDEYVGAGLDAAEAKEKAIQAVADALLAKEIAEATRDELINIIREQTAGGDIVPEVVRARGDEPDLGSRLNSIDQDLAQADDNLNERAVNVMYPNPPLIGAKSDGSDQTEIIQQILNNSKPYDTIFIPKGVVYDLLRLDFPDNISVKYFDLSKGTYEKVEFINHIHSNGIPVNEFEFSSAYHTGLILNVRTDLNVDVAQTDTTDATSIVHRLNGKSLLINTVYGDSRYRVRHINKNINTPFGQTVYEINAETGDLIYSKPIRMSTTENNVPENRFAVSRMLGGYSDYQVKNYYIDNVNGDDESADGTIENPYKTFKRMAYECLPYIAYGQIIVVFLTDYDDDIDLRGLVNLHENRLTLRTQTQRESININGNVVMSGLINFTLQDLFFNGSFEIYNSMNLLMNRSGTSHENGYLLSNVTGRILENVFDNVNYGIRATSNSNIISENNSGSGTIRMLSSTNGATIKKIGSQADGPEFSDEGSIIIPNNNTSFTSNDGKNVTVKNGIIISVD